VVASASYEARPLGMLACLYLGLVASALRRLSCKQRYLRPAFPEAELRHLWSRGGKGRAPGQSREPNSEKIRLDLNNERRSARDIG
jgi:hypothetical protein